MKSYSAVSTAPKNGGRVCIFKSNHHSVSQTFGNMANRHIWQSGIMILEEEKLVSTCLNLRNGDGGAY